PRRVTKDLVLLVRKRHCGCHRDRIPRVDAHGVDVLDGTHHDEVVATIAHDLELELLPAENALLDEDLGRRRLRQSPSDLRFELGLVPGNATARSAQGERGPKDRGKAGALNDGPRLRYGVSDPGTGTCQTDLLHGLFEEGAIFRLRNRVGAGAEYLDVV